MEETVMVFFGRFSVYPQVSRYPPCPKPPINQLMETTCPSKLGSLSVKKLVYMLLTWRAKKKRFGTKEIS